MLIYLMIYAEEPHPLQLAMTGNVVMPNANEVASFEGVRGELR
jgi:hypothetical protein